MRALVSNSIYAKKGRNGPPGANQVVSRDEPRCSQAICTLWVHPPTSPYLTVLLETGSAEAEPVSKDIARSDLINLKVS